MLAALQGLVGEVYAASGDAARFASLPHVIARAFEAQHTHIVMMDRGGSVACDFVTAFEAAREYFDHYAVRDIAVQRAMSGLPGVAVTQHDLMTATELGRCPVQQEFLPKHDAAQRMWAKSVIGPRWVLLTGIMRSAKQRAFEPGLHRTLEYLQPHLEHSLGLHRRLLEAAARAATLEAGLDVIKTGLMVLDAAGMVVFANEAARGMVGPDRCLRFKAGRLTASMPSADAQLQGAIARSTTATAGRTGAALTIPRERGRSLLVRVVPCAWHVSGGSAATGATAVLLHDPDQGRMIDEAALRALSLTPAEVRLVKALVAGDTISTYSRKCKLTENTIRSVLKTVFLKTSTRRQSELMALVLPAATLP